MVLLEKLAHRLQISRSYWEHRMLSFRGLPLALCGLVLIGSTVSHAQGLHAVSPLDGVRCMEPNITEAQMLKQGTLPIIRQDPSNSSPELGRTAAQIIAYDPAHLQNGFLEVLTPLGKRGWVLQNQLMPYQNTSNPKTRCIPSLMSNGRPGFSFTH